MNVLLKRAASPSVIFSFAYAAAIYLFIYLPVVILVLFSFQKSTIPVFPFDGPSLQWYDAVFSDSRIMDALLNSLLVGLSSSVISVVLGFLTAYGIARNVGRAQGVLQWIMMAPMMVSYLIIAMGLLIAFNTLGISKSIFAVVIGHVVINLPLSFAIIFSQMGAHQEKAECAARDLGAAEWQVLLFVSAPMLWPPIVASFLLSFTFSWDEFIIALLVSRFDVTLPVEIWNLLRSGMNPKVNAIGSFVFLVSVALVICAEMFVFRRKFKNDR